MRRAGMHAGQACTEQEHTHARVKHAETREEEEVRNVRGQAGMVGTISGCSPSGAPWAGVLRSTGLVLRSTCRVRIGCLPALASLHCRCIRVGDNSVTASAGLTYVFIVRTRGTDCPCVS